MLKDLSERDEWAAQDRAYRMCIYETWQDKFAICELPQGESDIACMCLRVLELGVYYLVYAGMVYIFYKPCNIAFGVNSYQRAWQTVIACETLWVNDCAVEDVKPMLV